MSTDALLLLVCGVSLLAAASGAVGALGAAASAAMEGDDEAHGDESEPLCPTASTHFRCDLHRCARYEEEVHTGGLCSRVCAERAPTCLHRKYVCDGVPDCEDGADEARCPQCSLHAFPCDGACRRKELLCDSAYR